MFYICFYRLQRLEDRYRLVVRDQDRPCSNCSFSSTKALSCRPLQTTASTCGTFDKSDPRSFTRSSSSARGPPIQIYNICIQTIRHSSYNDLFFILKTIIGSPASTCRFKASGCTWGLSAATCTSSMSSRSPSRVTSLTGTKPSSCESHQYQLFSLTLHKLLPFASETFLFSFLSTRLNCSLLCPLFQCSLLLNASFSFEESRFIRFLKKKKK